MRSFLPSFFALSGLLLSSVSAEHETSHQIVRREDGSFETREIVSLEERQRRQQVSEELRKRQSVSSGGVGVGLAGASAGIGNVTLKIGNIHVKTGNVELENIHIGDITVLVEAGVGKRSTDDQYPLPEGVPEFAPGQIPDGPVQAVVVAGDETVIYTPPGATSATSAASTATSTPVNASETRTAVAVATAKPTVHDLAKRQSVSLPSVGASVGPIGVGVGNVNVTVGDVLVQLGDITVKNVTIGDILVSVKINAQHAIETLVGVLPSVLSDVSSIVSDVSSVVSSVTGNADAARKTTQAEEAMVTRFLKERRDA